MSNLLNTVQPFGVPILIGTIGGVLSYYLPQAGRRTALLFGGLGLILIIVLAVTGWVHLQANMAYFHKWLGHYAVIYFWFCIPFAVGVLVQQQGSKRPVATIFRIVCLLLLLGCIFLASFTGYLRPSVQNAATEPNAQSEPIDPTSAEHRFTHDEIISEETENRFIVIHMGLFPLVIVAMHVAWLYFFRSTE